MKHVMIKLGWENWIFNNWTKMVNLTYLAYQVLMLQLDKYSWYQHNLNILKNTLHERGQRHQIE